MGMTIAEKILARKGGRESVRPGDIVTVEVDTVILFDNNFMPANWRDILKIRDPGRIVVVMDHRVPAPNQMAAAAHVTARAFAEKFSIKRVHDVGYDQGISHQLVADLGYGIPGTVLVCSDSHTCSAGVFNCLARGVGGPDVFYSAIKGETWFRCGDTVRYELTGALSNGVTTKDAFLQIAGKHGDHATMNVEYGGPGIASLSINARKTLTTMSAELSAEFATFEPDDVLIDWVRARSKRIRAGLSRCRCEISRGAQDRSRRARAARGISRLGRSELAAGERSGRHENRSGVHRLVRERHARRSRARRAQVVAGRRVAPGVRFLVVPASQLVYRQAIKSGAMEKLVDAGAVIGPPTCGACGGGHMGVIGPDETCITATTRNFKGRMGDPSSRVFMGSPATVAASALTGYITDPREFLN